MDNYSTHTHTLNIGLVDFRHFQYSRIINCNASLIIIIHLGAIMIDDARAVSFCLNSIREGAFSLPVSRSSIYVPD